MPIDSHQSDESFRQNFRRFFLRGMAIVMPSVLTIWVIIAGYNFLNDTVAEPINQGIRNAVLRVTSYPSANIEEQLQYLNSLDARNRKNLMDRMSFDTVISRLPHDERLREINSMTPEARASWIERWDQGGYLHYQTRKDKLLTLWRQSSYPLDLIGVVVAIVIIYLAGGILGSYVGHKLYQRGESMLARVPFIRSLYPAMKQLTDFFFGPKDKKIHFKRVVAVEYPRKGMWSLALVTGGSFPAIDKAAGKPCLTVYLPSTPMGTGYAIVVPADEIIDLPLSIDEALKRVVSGGVVSPAELEQKPVATDDAIDVVVKVVEPIEVRTSAAGRGGRR